MANAILESLGEPVSLQDYLTTTHGRGLGYEAIGKDLHSITDGVISISYMTVKRWLIDFGIVEEAS